MGFFSALPWSKKQKFPATTSKAPYDIYAESMINCFHGFPLWKPGPPQLRPGVLLEHVSIAHVGYIHEGRFKLLFDAGEDVGSRQRGVDIPDDFSFNPRFAAERAHPVPEQPRPASAEFWGFTESMGLQGSASISGSAGVPGLPSASASLDLQTTREQGAILKTRDQTHVLNAASPDVFKEYMRRNYRSWVRFGQDNYHSVDYDNLVIVTGVDLTSSCSMLAYAKNSTEMNASFSLDAAVFGSASLSAWKDRKHPERSWLSSGSDDYLASLARPALGPLVTPVESGAPLPRQCVFLRGWRSRLRRAPTRLEGGAGPDDPELPPGPERPDTPCVSDHEVSACADATSADEEVDIVPISDSPMFSDPLQPLFDYVFENTEAVLALVHDAQCYEIMVAGREAYSNEHGCGQQQVEDLTLQQAVQLAQPVVEVDSGGVGTLRTPISRVKKAERKERERRQRILLGKAKWPDDFLDTSQQITPPAALAEEIEVNSSVTPPISGSPPQMDMVAPARPRSGRANMQAPPLYIDFVSCPPMVESQPRRPSLDAPTSAPSHHWQGDSPIALRATPPRGLRPRPDQETRRAHLRVQNTPVSSNATTSGPESRDLIRSAASLLCQELVRNTSQFRLMTSDQDFEEVEVRMRNIARLERIWGKSRAVDTFNSGESSATGEERERRAFSEALRDGYVLCQFMNKLRPGSLADPSTRDDGFVRTSNITRFLATCSIQGVPSEDLFQRDDLIEASAESLTRVSRAVLSLFRITEVPTTDWDDVYSSSVADRPKLLRGRFTSEVDGASSRRRPLPDSFDIQGSKLGRARSESMINLGVVSSNPSASDIKSHDSVDIGQRVIVKEEGKPAVQYQLGNCVGRGQFGSVHRALNLTTGQMVAVKRIRLEVLKEEEIKQLMREIDLVKSLSHPSIVKYEGMSRDHSSLSIVLEFAENGSLGQTLLNERLVASYVVKILDGLHYLHQCHVVHGDLKAANILTTKTGDVKLSDFGVSLNLRNLRVMEREGKVVAGTPDWMAPEVIELKGVSYASDIWSLACTIIELLTGRPPYADIPNSMTVMLRIVENDTPPFPEGCSEFLEDFLRQCFNKDPSKRPTAEQLCEHEWLKQNWEAGKELRQQDSILFLRRVSTDVQQKSPAVARYLGQADLPSESDEGSSDESPRSPMKRNSNATSAGRAPFMDSDSIMAPREHSFVKTAFGKPMTCRVCMQSVKKSAVICAECSLIAHWKCAKHAPLTCGAHAMLHVLPTQGDVSSRQISLDAQSSSGVPSTRHTSSDVQSSYGVPSTRHTSFDVQSSYGIPSTRHTSFDVQSSHGVSSSCRTSFDVQSSSGASLSPHLNRPPMAFKSMTPFPRSRSSLSKPEPDGPPPGTTSDDHLPLSPLRPRRRIVLKRSSLSHERPASLASISTGRAPSISSMRSALTVAESFSSHDDRGAIMPTTEVEPSRPSHLSAPKGSQSRSLQSTTASSAVADTGVPGTIPVTSNRPGRHRRGKSSDRSCVVQ